MSGTAAISHTVIVSPEEAWGYIRAAIEVPSVRIETFVPATERERQLCIAEHLGTLIGEHGGPASEAGELTSFVVEADTALRGAFDEPEGAVLVRVHTPNTDGAAARLSMLSLLGCQYQATLN